MIYALILAAALLLIGWLSYREGKRQDLLTPEEREQEFEERVW